MPYKLKLQQATKDTITQASQPIYPFVVGYFPLDSQRITKYFSIDLDKSINIRCFVF